MSKVNTLFSYFQKTPSREKSSDSVAGSCKIDDNANVQSSADANRAVSSTGHKSKRSPAKLLSKKSTNSSDRLAQTGKMAVSKTRQCSFACVHPWELGIPLTFTNSNPSPPILNLPYL